MVEMLGVRTTRKRQTHTATRMHLISLVTMAVWPSAVLSPRPFSVKLSSNDWSCSPQRCARNKFKRRSGPSAHGRFPFSRSPHGVMTLGYDVDRRWGDKDILLCIYVVWCAAQWEEPHGLSPTERRPIFIRDSYAGMELDW